MTTEKRVGVGFGALLQRGRQVLLGRRHSDPQKASSLLHGEGTWTLPGGKLRFHETFEAAVKREVMEETGIRVNEKALALVSVTNDIVHDAHFVTLGFLCEEFSGSPQVREPEEIVCWEWFDLDNLPEPLFFPSQSLILNYKSGIVFQSAKAS